MTVYSNNNSNVTIQLLNLHNISSHLIYRLYRILSSHDDNVTYFDGTLTYTHAFPFAEGHREMDSIRN